MTEESRPKSITISWEDYLGNADRACWEAMESLICVQNLIKLMVDFCSTKVNDEGCRALQLILRHSSKTLKNLEIDFGPSSEITDEGLRILSTSILDLSQLTNVFLYFMCIQAISD
eukprot:TRINITY_DN18077_c0_g1_i2.p1 TRINITY_DN18077_c0_g1~~TRINITY_DN18077_c0_g1_i2.p1  ORF type:complete len:116 (+),score=9.84 TRINITY_DN18077_c0_g1_i2:199-546(+)